MRRFPSPIANRLRIKPFSKLDGVLLIHHFVVFPAGEGLVKALPRLHPYRSPKSFSAFSFDATGTKEKAWQKENAVKGISLLRERPRLRLWNPQTFEKV